MLLGSCKGMVQHATISADLSDGSLRVITYSCNSWAFGRLPRIRCFRNQSLNGAQKKRGLRGATAAETMPASNPQWCTEVFSSSESTLVISRAYLQNVHKGARDTE